MSYVQKEDVESFTDFAGQEVKRGDYIVYGRMHLQSGDLNAAKVVNIQSGINYRQVWSITVIALDDDYENGRSMSKKINLRFPDRIVKFDNLPQNYKNLLDSV